jgi:thiol-disulfide isomerase/thioredoxin
MIPIRRLLFLIILLAASPRALHAQDSASFRTVPHFAVASLDDPGTLISEESLRGRTCLVDFWATWCPPCVEEIPHLAKAYEKFHARGFEILSLSFDKSPEQIKLFRSKRFPMPWLHGYVERGFGSYIAEIFRVENIPRQVLIGPNGDILATDEALRGSRLETTLEQYLH